MGIWLLRVFDASKITASPIFRPSSPEPIAMRWTLRYQIMVPMAAVMLLAVLFVEGVGVLLAVHDTESQIEAQIREVARIAEEASFPLTDAVLRQMQALSGAELVVTDESGRTVASSGISADASNLSR